MSFAFAEPGQPRVWAYQGDSVTAGTGSTSPYGFPWISRSTAGTQNISPTSVINGVGGTTLAQIVATIPAVIAAGAKGVVIEGGLNDAVINNSAVSVIAASLTTGIGYCTAAGIPCVVLTTTPTYGAGLNTPTILALIYQYVQWIQTNVPLLGGTVADTYTAVVDTPGPTGQMQTQYSNTATGTAGDGEHPGPMGHFKIGQTVGLAQLAAMAGLPVRFNWSAFTNLHPNPLNTGAGTVPTGSVYTNFGGASSTNSIVTDSSGFLPAGKWAQADIVSNASNSINELVWNIPSSSWKIGDVLAFGGYAQYQDISSGYLNNLFQVQATFSEFILKQNTAAVVAEVFLAPNTGPNLQLYTIPAGTTQIDFAHQFRLKASGGEIQYRVGNMYLYNLTRMGLNGLVV